ncbi:hypothetical protein [Caudoviricetes sp.]|nr:hypothetical protein [Caudoviricetes sp.]
MLMTNGDTSLAKPWKCQSMDHIRDLLHDGLIFPCLRFRLGCMRFLTMCSGL